MTNSKYNPMNTKNRRNFILLLLATLTLSSSLAYADRVVTDKVYMWSRIDAPSKVCETYTRYVDDFTLAVPILNQRHIEYRDKASYGIIHYFGTIHDDHVAEIESSVELLNAWPTWGYVQYKVCADIDDGTANPLWDTTPITFFEGTVDILLLD